MPDATRPCSDRPLPATTAAAATLVRLLASVIDLVVTDFDPVAGEPAMQQAVDAAASALLGLADDDPERTSAALSTLVEVVAQLPTEEPTPFDRWREQVRSLAPVLATARQVVRRMEAMVDEFSRLATDAGVATPAARPPSPAAVIPSDEPAVLSDEPAVAPQGPVKLSLDRG